MAMGCCKDNPLIDQWENVFWIAYALDCDLALRYGRLPARRYEDAAQIPLPTTHEQRQIQSDEGGWRIDYLRIAAEISLIQARVSERLLKNHNDDSVSKLLNDLHQWRRHWIFNQAPRSLAQNLHRSDLMAFMFLEGSYHLTLFSIYTHLALLNRRSGLMFDVDTLLQVAKEKKQPALEDSRRFIDFVRVLPKGDVAWAYHVVHNLVASVIVLLSHAQQNKADAQIRADVEFSKYVMAIINHISKKCAQADCRKVQMILHQLYERAELAGTRS
ncbi:uncharacterized protein AB675_4084 [Cyphellophora attinorum]|uniref:Transcription factor domain-containing protein n=1 Tax=Cyphellophora attinorum TaxID=1664694 RepID=A0A0N1HRV1_9EURO|nr:uncharacterized protein AB675_4084 [Phialophora attinorum]KPI38660.1 hypothetical protein AB675_4084 [Phialophora attinorum]